MPLTTKYMSLHWEWFEPLLCMKAGMGYKYKTKII